jgi:hypothetical protein
LRNRVADKIFFFNCPFEVPLEVIKMLYIRDEKGEPTILTSVEFNDSERK